jgi:hypothetical protein
VDRHPGADGPAHRAAEPDHPGLCGIDQPPLHAARRAVEPTIDSLPDELELKEQALPNAADWETASAARVQPVRPDAGQTLNAANVGKLVDEVKKAADASARRWPDWSRRCATVRRATRAGITGARQQSAESAQALLASLAQAAEGDVVTTLATATLQTSEAAVSRTLGQAQACADALTSGNWQLFDVVRDLGTTDATRRCCIMSRLARR